MNIMFYLLKKTNCSIRTKQYRISIVMMMMIIITLIINEIIIIIIR